MASLACLSQVADSVTGYVDGKLAAYTTVEASEAAAEATAADLQALKVSVSALLGWASMCMYVRVCVYVRVDADSVSAVFPHTHAASMFQG